MDVRFGMVASVIANVNRDPKKRRQPFTPNDFFPDPTAEPEELPELTLEALKMDLIASGATIVTRSEETDGAGD